MSIPPTHEDDMRAAHAEADLAAAGAIPESPEDRDHDRRLPAEDNRCLATHGRTPNAQPGPPRAQPESGAPQGDSSSAAARRAGAETAHELITALADAGMSADRIDQAAEDVLGGRYDHPTPTSERFYAAFDDTAATYVAELRELEAG